MGFKEDIIPYIDSIGLVQNRIPDKDSTSVTSGNGILFTAEAMINLARCGELTSELNDIFLTAIDSCQVKLPNGQYIRGLFKRHPFSDDQESIDDYIALGAMSSITYWHWPRTISERILFYGKEEPYYLLKFIPLYYYYPNANQTKFDFNAWLGRFPALICHLEFSLGITPDIWKRIWWIVSIFLATRKPVTDLDSRILSWLMIHTLDNHANKDKFWMCKWVIKFFYKKLWKQYPGGMQEIFTKYFSNNHPLGYYSITE